MDRHKLRILIGIGIALILLFMVLSWTFGDSARPLFYDTLVTHNTVVELSSMAVSDANNPGTRALAARIGSTTASDRNQLLEFYELEYGGTVKAVHEKDVEELDKSHEEYDALYRELARKHLKQSRPRLQALQKNFTNKEFHAIVKKALSNQDAHLQSLSRN